MTTPPCNLANDLESRTIVLKIRSRHPLRLPAFSVSGANSTATEYCAPNSKLRGNPSVRCFSLHRTPMVCICFSRWLAFENSYLKHCFLFHDLDTALRSLFYLSYSWTLSYARKAVDTIESQILAAPVYTESADRYSAAQAYRNLTRSMKINASSINGPLEDFWNPSHKNRQMTGFYCRSPLAGNQRSVKIEISRSSRP